MFIPTDPLSSIRWFPVVNVSGEEIPAFACMRIAGDGTEATPSTETGQATTTREGQVVIRVGKPRAGTVAGGFRRLYLINSPSPIAIDGYGSGTFGPYWVAADSTTIQSWADGDQTWGPKPGSWLIWPTYYGFKPLGQLTTPDRAYCVQEMVNSIMVDPATDNILTSTGNDTGWDAPGLSGDETATAWWCVWFGDGWIVVANDRDSTGYVQLGDALYLN